MGDGEESKGLTQHRQTVWTRAVDLERLAALAALANAVPADAVKLAEALDAMAPLHWTARDVKRNLPAVQDARELARQALAALHGWSVQFHPGKGKDGAGQYRPTYDEEGEPARVAAALKLTNSRIAGLRNMEPRMPVVQRGVLSWTGADEGNPLVYVADLLAAITADPRRVHRCLKVDCGTFLFDSRPVIRGTGRSYCNVLHGALARDALARLARKSLSPRTSLPAKARAKAKR